jgi:trehalose-6-phosphate synthase
MSLRLPQRLPLYSLADVFLVTSTRDGLNRMPLEYVAAHHRYPPAEGEGARAGVS